MVSTLERAAPAQTEHRRPREINLRIPGPTALPPSVRRALGGQMINHRGPEFAALQHETVEGVKRVFQTKNDVLFFPGSGTGGLEAAVVNCFSPGDPVLSITIGSFGERWCDIARAFGLAVDHMPLEWGTAADPDAVRQRLKSGPPVKGVLITHNETSTGVTNPIAEIAPIVRDAGALLLVDAVSSMAALPFDTDAWGVDVAITGSQKAWMIPPGMTMLSVSERAWQATEQAKLPRSYWDFRAMRRYMERGQTPYTPAITIMYGLREALQLIEKEGLENVFQRHHQIGEFTRRGVTRLGLELAGDPRYYSDTVTAVVAPPGVDMKAVHKRLREEYGVVLATGQEQWRDTHFRIGHLGYVRRADVQQALAALGEVLGRPLR
ncbi:MAG: alanine--glyoxylate aminotransferase family protein [Chloroflexi bacterium]|nr:alanine--glyoxylate aminotransferase family protein [Chloroflexota bacterium]